jgi:hypothetical protein
MDVEQMFVIYYAGLVAFQYHPANKEDWDKVDLEALARVADAMCDMTINRLERPWRG